MRLKKMVTAMLSVSCAVFFVACSGGGSQNNETDSDVQEETMDDVTENVTENETEEADGDELQKNEITFQRVSVHDPSIVKDGDTYYIFGSHIPDGGYAKSTDLRIWKTFDLNVKTDYATLLAEPYEKWSKSSGSDIKGNMWAPDVIYNETMGKWCMYMSLNGNNWQSVIVLLTADNIEGPYEYAGNVIYSGFYDKGNTTSTLNQERANYSDIYKVLGEGANLSKYNSANGCLINAIDPNVTYDDEGNIWMTYGSWSAGIFQIKIDPETGLRDYDYQYTDRTEDVDPYYGYKLAGGYYVSGEAPYIIKAGDYYFLFVTYGGLSASEGYNMRLFRSESINGPYIDQTGRSAVYTTYSKNYGRSRGLKLLGNNIMTGFNEKNVQVAQGHNSAFVDDDGKIYLVYHTRFTDREDGTHQSQSEMHQVRVHQMFLNSEGWLVVAPFEYSGETIADEYTTEQVAGVYDFIINKQENWFHYSCFKNDNIHDHDMTLHADSTKLGIAEAEEITLNSDGTVTGAYSGTWKLSGNQITLDLGSDGVYEGVFLEQADETVYRYTRMTFTAAGECLTVLGVRK